MAGFQSSACLGGCGGSINIIDRRHAMCNHVIYYLNITCSSALIQCSIGHLLRDLMKGHKECAVQGILSLFGACAPVIILNRIQVTIGGTNTTILVVHITYNGQMVER